MSRRYLKRDLIAELAETVGITQVQADAVVKQLALIAYREARDGFTVPGICKLDVARRKARKARIPSTGQRILIGEHDALRAKPLKKAQHAVAPRMPGLVQYIEEDTTPAAAEAPAPEAPAAPATDAQPYNPEGLVSFRCGSCGQEIEAPFDMAGTASECPACSGAIEVPYMSEPGTIWGRTIAQAKPAVPAAPERPASQEAPTPSVDSEAQMGRTIRIELPDDV